LPAETSAASDSGEVPRRRARGRGRRKRSRKPGRNGRFPLKPRLAYGLAAASGVLYFLGFPGMDLWPLSFVALVPLIVALEGQTPRRSAGLGWMAGFVMTMTGFYWLLEMLQVFSGFGTLLCILFMSVLCAYQGGRIALLGWLHGRATGRGWPRPVVFGLAFAASELVFPLLFPWYFGASVHQVPLLLQVAEWGGPIGVGLVLVAANLATAEWIVARLNRRRPPWRLIAALSAVLLLAGAYGALRIPAVDARVRAAPKATIGVVQANMSLLGKRRDKAEGLRRHLRLTQQLRSGAPVDLVVWSETSVTRAVDENAVTRLLPRYFTRQLGGPAIVGSVLLRRVDDARRYVLFNSALVTNAAGDVTGRYDKRYLLAFGEYLPFGEDFPVLYEWSPNSGHFTPGTRLQPVKAAGHTVAVLICYEDILPSYVNKLLASGKVELLVNMTNDAWFGDTTEPWIHLALSKLRAVEHRRYLVRSVNSGVSAFVDPVGRLVAHTKPFEEATLRSQIAWMSGRSPFLILGQAPWWLASAIIAAMAFLRHAKAGPSTRKRLRTPTQ